MYAKENLYVWILMRQPNRPKHSVSSVKQPLEKSVIVALFGLLRLDQAKFGKGFWIEKSLNEIQYTRSFENGKLGVQVQLVLKYVARGYTRLSNGQLWIQGNANRYPAYEFHAMSGIQQYP